VDGCGFGWVAGSVGGSGDCAAAASSGEFAVSHGVAEGFDAFDAEASGAGGGDAAGGGFGFEYGDACYDAGSYVAFFAAEF
jgi:hypothetical protein